MRVLLFFYVKLKEDSQKDFDNKLLELSQIKFPKPVIIGSSNNLLEFFNHALEIAALKRVKSTVLQLKEMQSLRKN